MINNNLFRDLLRYCRVTRVSALGNADRQTVTIPDSLAKERKKTMGNRAVITACGWCRPEETDMLGVYLHWNGGRDSVEAFLTYCKLKGYRAPDQDCYGWARLCQVIGNFFGGSNSIGIDRCSALHCNNGDNGVYVIRGWEIVARRYFYGIEQNNYDLLELLVAIDESQPTKEQLGEEKIKQLLVLVKG